MTSRAKRALRASCLSYFFLIAVNYAAAAFEQERFSTSLGASAFANPPPAFYGVISNCAFVGALIATLGLLARKRWAAYGHVAATTLMVASGYPGEVVLAGGPRVLVSTAIYVLTGIIYGLAFFTDALLQPEA